MKILLITARFYPEPFTITNIAEELAKRGHEITVLTGRPNSGKWGIYPGYKNVKEEEYKGMRIIRLKEIPRKKGTIGLIINYLSIRKIFSKALRKMNEKFDIVFSHVMSPIFVLNGVSDYCKKTNTPHFHYGFDLWPESLVATGYSKRKGFLFNQIKKVSIKNYQGCDAIAFASPSAENYLKEYLNLKIDFKHIYQPCLTKKPLISFVSDHVYKKNEKLHILFCGTIAKFNHLDLMINALDTDIFKSKVVFDIVGSGSDKERIERIVTEKSLNETVIFHGRVSSDLTKEYYKRADVLFVPLFYNSATSLMIPQKLIEYLMYSRPIIGMIKGDGAYLLKKSSELNVISDQTVESLRDSIMKMANMPVEVLEQCGKENRDYIDNNPCFSIEYICDEIEKSLFALKSKNESNKKDE